MMPWKSFNIKDFAYFVRTKFFCQDKFPEVKLEYERKRKF